MFYYLHDSYVTAVKMRSFRQIWHARGRGPRPCGSVKYCRHLTSRSSWPGVVIVLLVTRTPYTSMYIIEGKVFFAVQSRPRGEAELLQKLRDRTALNFNVPRKPFDPGITRCDVGESSTTVSARARRRRRRRRGDGLGGGKGSRETHALHRLGTGQRRFFKRAHLLFRS